ncbi:MAG TPA: hypothetical protein VFT51_08845 [Bacillales bacterium]|nr:hypothetical protein [Bacillales bacterium]
MFKKVNIGLTVLVVLFVVFEFTGKGQAQNQHTFPANVATIQPADFTEHEKGLLEAGGANKVFAFQYHLPEQNMKYVDVWIELYKNGKDEGKRFAHSSLIKGTKDGLLFLTVQKLEIKKSQMVKWISTVISDNGSGRSSITRKSSIHKGGALTIQGGSGKIIPGEAITLAVTVQDPDASSFVVPNGIFAKENHKDVLKRLRNQYQYVYLLKCKFRNSPEGGF